jgi:hypothetical protein
MRSHVTAAQWMTLAASGILLALCWTTRATDSPVMWDAGDNLIMMLNLERHDVISLSNEAPYTPTMYREPLPILLGQFAIAAVDQALGPTDREYYFRGERARLLKLILNLPWLALLGIVTFALARELGLSFIPSLACVLALNCILFRGYLGYFMMDSLYSEASASALLSLGSLLLLVGIRRSSIGRIALAGVTFGLLLLVKAVYLYLVLSMVIATPIVAMLVRGPVVMGLRWAIVLSAAALLVASPWMFRNYRDFGYFAVSLRGGEALYDRAVTNQMNFDEYVGSYYFFAPYPINGALRRFLGYSNQDTDEGGRLQRLNEGSGSKFFLRDYFAELDGKPQDAITYMHRAGAERIRLRNQLQAAGDPYPLVTADRTLRQRALSMILHHPLRDVALIPMYLWQGAFFAFPILFFALIDSIRQRKFDVSVAMLPAIGSLLFYATFAHLETRYAMPTYPLAVCMLVALVASRYRRQAVHEPVSNHSSWTSHTLHNRTAGRLSEP